MKFIDTHAHLYLKHFKKDLPEVIRRAEENLLAVVLPNIDTASLNDLQNLVEQNPDFSYAGLGLHPTSVKENFKQELKNIEQKLPDFPNLVAIGECGLDFYWDTTYVEEQFQALDVQIQWAKALKLPIILHARNSMDELINFIAEKQDGNLKGVFHCFTGTEEQARKIQAETGFLLGIGGVFTFKNSGLDKVLKNIGIGNVVLETDSPYLTPVPFRGKRNESAYVKYVAENMSEKLNLPLEEIRKKTNENSIGLFNLQAETINT